MAVSTILDTASAEAILKENYHNNGMPPDLILERHPTLALMKKYTEAVGETIPVPIITGGPQGRSANFTQSVANQTAPAMQKFQITLADDFQTISLSNKALLQSNTNAGAFAKALTVDTETAIKNLTNSFTSALFRDGTGTIATIDTIGAMTGIIHFVVPTDVVQFVNNVGQTIQAATTSGATPRAAYGYIVAVDASSGVSTITVSSTAGGSGVAPAGWTAGDVILAAGDSNAKIVGLPKWLQGPGIQSNDSFFGVNRSSNKTMLGGVYWDGTGTQIESALLRASQFGAQFDGVHNYCPVSFGTYSALLDSLGAKKQYTEIKPMGNISFEGVQIIGANGPIKVYPDKDCPDGVAYLLDMSSWEILSMGEVPHLNMGGDGLAWLRLATADACQARFVYYAQLSCNAPGHNVRVALDVL